MKQHLLEKKALSEVCDANGIHPTMYYRWLKELLSNAVYAFGKREGQGVPGMEE